MTSTAASPSKRGRSPSYPGIHLREALRRAEQMHSIDGKSQAAIDTILQHWGHKPKSGAGLVAVAALIKFGLLADEGSGTGRRVRLTEDALRILLDKREDSTERTALIRTSALRPPIHKELWEHYQGALPSDATIKHYLIFDRGFTEGGADELIAEFRETITFAGLSAGDSMSGSTEDKGEKPGSGTTGAADTGGSGTPPADPNVRQPAPGAKTMPFPLPLAPNVYATLEAEFPMTESNWQRMLVVLEAFKPGLTRPDDPGPTTAVTAPQPVVEVASEAGLTAEAEQLVAKVDSGGVPAFMNAELERIARENGVEVTPDMTPNEAIDALKARL